MRCRAVKFFLAGCTAKSVRSPDRAYRRSTVDWAFIESKQKRYVQAVITRCGVCGARVKVPGYTPTGIWVHPCSWRRPGNRSVHLVCTHLVLYLRFTSSRHRRLRRSGSVNLSHLPSASSHSSGLALNLVCTQLFLYLRFTSSRSHHRTSQ